MAVMLKQSGHEAVQADKEWQFQIALAREYFQATSGIGAVVVEQALTDFIRKSTGQTFTGCVLTIDADTGRPEYAYCGHRPKRDRAGVVRHWGSF